MTDLDVSKRLIETGWRQGSLFECTNACIPFLFWGDGSARETETRSSGLEDGEKFLVASQTCDINAPASKEPYVEALVCRNESNQSILSGAANSTRWFRLCMDQSLVAYAARRVLVDKKSLLGVTPEPFPGGEDRLTKYSSWLGRRYDRPALPDAVVDGFQKPTLQCLRTLKKQNPELSNAFNFAVQQIRVGLPEADGEQTAQELHVVCLLNSPRGELSELEDDAIKTVMASIIDAANPELVSVNRDYDVLAEEEISLAYYWATKMVSLDQMTYKGEETIGAEPGRG